MWTAGKKSAKVAPHGDVANDASKMTTQANHLERRVLSITWLAACLVILFCLYAAIVSKFHPESQSLVYDPAQGLELVIEACDLDLVPVQPGGQARLTYDARRGAGEPSIERDASGTVTRVVARNARARTGIESIFAAYIVQVLAYSRSRRHLPLQQLAAN